ncbi:MAG: hypothetical protein LAN36_08830 [Acidobacteriia bacterium]|nr:hypothetical protein [Terriglobia bacterium]
MNPNTASSRASFVPRSRITAYIFIVLAAILAASYYRLRTDSIFACQANGYSKGQYLAYCQSDGYGDFDHGAFWFDLEPAATRSAAAADVLFIGNSRMQYGFSSTAAQDWLAKNTPSYYLLGFAYNPRVQFERALLSKLAARPRVYVINLDTFFEENGDVPARIVMDEPNALSRYQHKQRWQYLHRAVCGKVAGFCGNSYSFFRTRQTGVWQSSGAISANKAVSVDPKFDAEMVARETVSGRVFLDSLGVVPGCIIFTLVPTVDTPSATSSAIATALHTDFIAPELGGLVTFDGSHLNRASAERWSAAFFQAAGPKIRDCLRTQTAPQVTSAN